MSTETQSPKRNLVAEFHALLIAGLDQGAALQAMSEFSKANEDFSDAISDAHSQYANDDVEIDAFPLISEADKGVWVSAWVWVPLPEKEIDDPQGDKMDKARDLDEEKRA